MTEPGVAIAGPGARTTAPMLVLESVEVYYGNIAAVKGLSLEVRQGEIVTLLGSNGAGKSTTLRAISGLIPTRGGAVWFNGQRLNGEGRSGRGAVPAHQVVRRGIAHAPEGRRIFAGMSVDENLDLGAFVRSDKDGVAADKEQVYDLFPRLRERSLQHAGTLSGGEQQMLAVGRALMANPDLILMDEPSEGLSPKLVQQVQQLMHSVREHGHAVLLVEQNFALAMALADTIYVVSAGRFVFQGTPAALAAATEVLDQHVGVARAA